MSFSVISKGIGITIFCLGAAYCSMAQICLRPTNKICINFKITIKLNIIRPHNINILYLSGSLCKYGLRTNISRVPI